MKPYNPYRRGADDCQPDITNADRAFAGEQAIRKWRHYFGHTPEHSDPGDCITDILHYLHSRGIEETGIREALDRALHHWMKESGQHEPEPQDLP